MSTTGAQPVWQADNARGLYFYIDPRTGDRIYQDGSRVPRPPNNAHLSRQNVPRQLPSAPYTQVPPPQPELGTSPTSSQRSGTGSTASTQSGGPQSPRAAISHLRTSTGGSAAAYVGQTGSVPAGYATQGSLTGAMSGLQIGGPATAPFQPGQSGQPGATGPITPTISQNNGVRIVTAQDPDSLVTTNIGTGPPERITDPVLYDQGVRARRALYPTAGDEEQLFSNFKIRKNDFFVLGRVFKILWSEPAGETATAIRSTVRNDRTAPGLSRIRYNESVYSKVRRFVVVRVGNRFCSALPIVTYGAQGVGKRNVTKSDHGIIFSGSSVPQPLPDELPGRGEDPMRSVAIRVTPDSPEEKLDPGSRIDYAKVHTIHQNLKVAPVGFVHPNFIAALDTQWRSVWLAPAATGPVAANSTRSAGQRADSTNSGNPPSTVTAGVGLIEEESEGEESVSARPSASRMQSGATARGVSQAPSTQANTVEVERTRQAYRQLITQGRTHVQAVQAIVQQYVTVGQQSRERAENLVRLSLSTMSTAAASTRQTAAGAQGDAEESSSSEEDGSDDDDEDDEDEASDGGWRHREL